MDDRQAGAYFPSGIPICNFHKTDAITNTQDIFPLSTVVLTVLSASILLVLVYGILEKVHLELYCLHYAAYGMLYKLLCHHLDHWDSMWLQRNHELCPEGLARKQKLLNPGTNSLKLILFSCFLIFSLTYVIVWLISVNVFTICVPRIVITALTVS